MGHLVYVDVGASPAENQEELHRAAQVIACEIAIFTRQICKDSDVYDVPVDGPATGGSYSFSCSRMNDLMSGNAVMITLYD